MLVCKHTYLCIAMYVAVYRRGAKTGIQWMGTVKWWKEACFCLHGERGFLVNLALTSLVLLVQILVHDVAYHRVSYSHASRREVGVCFFWQLFLAVPACLLSPLGSCHPLMGCTDSLDILHHALVNSILALEKPLLSHHLSPLQEESGGGRCDHMPCCVANPWKWFSGGPFSSALEISTVALQHGSLGREECLQF